MNSPDGLKDALTNLASPTLLYEELRRELSRAKRNGVGLCAMKIMIGLSNKSHVISGSHAQAAKLGDQMRHSIFDREILGFTQSLSHETRGEDICARMGKVEFLVLLPAFHTSQAHFVERLLRRWDRQRSLDTRLRGFTRPSLEFSFVLSSADETSLALLNRLDMEPTLISVEELSDGE